MDSLFDVDEIASKNQRIKELENLIKKYLAEEVRNIKKEYPNAIIIEEGTKENTEIEKFCGYAFETMIASNYFFEQQK